MKNIILKSSLVGLVVGILMSFNMMFIGIGGQLAYYISLGFLLNSLHLSEEIGWIFGLIFFVLVYILYGIIIGFLIKKISELAGLRWFNLAD